MTVEQYRQITGDAYASFPYIVRCEAGLTSKQEGLHEGWARLGDEMGFDWTTVQRAALSTPRTVFYAVPTRLDEK